MKVVPVLFLCCLCLCKDANGQVGRVGINTTTPAALLHVKDSSVVFTGPMTALGLPIAPPPVNGSGTRMMWYVNKAAFRVGEAIGAQWSKDSTGMYSTAMGYDTRAFGYSSLAVGSNVNADGDFSIALGVNNAATGGQSAAIGSFLTSSGLFASSMGISNVASGEGSVALGTLCKSQGRYSCTAGYGLIANAHSMFVAGAFNDTTIACSPGNWCSNDPAFMIGIGLNGSDRKTAMTVLKDGRTGINTKAPASRLHILDGTGGAVYNTSAEVIIEDDNHTYLQFSNPSASDAGILSGNPLTPIRSGIIFRPDSAVQIRTGGDIAHLTIDKSGNTVTTGEIRRPATGSTNLVPICFGSVDDTGAILSGSGNFSVSATPPGYYEITITSETYTNGAYTTSATPVSSNPRMLSIGNTGGKLIVRTFTAAAVATDTNFHFVVYKQ